MTFLEFKTFRTLTRNGKGRKTVFRTEGKRFTRARVSMKESLHQMMHRKHEIQARRINTILMGYIN